MNRSPPKIAFSQFRPTVALILIWSGLVLMEAVSNHVIPLSLGKFTENALIIGLILAVNPLFGVLVQPIVGLLGDRMWTPWGRRTFFIKIAAPALSICLLLFPEASNFILLTSLVILFHFFLDVVYGADHPLLADLIPKEKRTFVMGWMLCAGQATQFLFLRYVMGHLVEQGGIELAYQTSAILALLLIFVAAFLIEETRPNPTGRLPMTFVLYFRDFWEEPMMRRFGLLSFFRSAGLNGMLGYVVLYSTKQMEIDQAAYAKIWSLTSLIYFSAAIPTGIIIERYFAKNWVLASGYGFIASSALLAFLGGGVLELYAVAILFGIGSLLDSVTIKPFYTEFMPADRLGHFIGALNICYGCGRLFALILCGALVKAFGNNYQAVWPIVIACMIVASYLALFIKDRGFIYRKSGNRIPLNQCNG